ncbi:hypothetical protein SAMD00079811_47980 [Scytonema sp. HK-05]|uniref:hypothetical protein n=1 Tax=Scytonema sp. HK-05 TaxID=1137095 RepID=UPI000936CF8B|nr:hypothetical protein [Scytonema sp. HK-05]OKH55401.1 hypothetical protein NIES2130_26615 [Scytonema sp. HK-05]BAY47182.1 hypothetical protein SAMD00079811_47980 [Scytonema sp. HK-05]
MKYAFIASALLVLGGLGFETGIVAAQTVKKPSTKSMTPQTTVATFQTPNYSVRVFRQGTQTRMNVFDKKTNKLQLNAAPVQVQNSDQQTSYTSSQGERQFRISVDQAGNRSVEINGPGEVIQETTN